MERIKGIYANVLHNNGIELIEGFATFQDGHTLSILNAAGDIVRTVTAANLLLATGGLPRKLEIPGADLAITSDEALALPQRPARIAIIGGGRVATEFACIFAGMGSEVHIVYRKPLPLTGAPSLQKRARGRVFTSHSGKATQTTARSAAQRPLQPTAEHGCRHGQRRPQDGARKP